MPTTFDYLNLITSEHREKPNFEAMVSVDVSLQVRVQELMTSLIEGFSVDFAIGAQLDIIGQWVGISRIVAVPIVGVFFEWDGTAAVGWEFGIWQGENEPDSGLVSLPDDIYRRFIKAKIAANHWDGTIEGAYAVWEIAFPDTTILIQDNQDMSMIIGFPGAPLDSLTKAMIDGGALALKPEGVLVNYAFSTLDAPLFGWDIQNANLDGWDLGTWGQGV